MSNLVRIVASLPQLPVVLPHPLEGDNVSHEALVLCGKSASAEQAVANFRANHAPENSKFFRRYYLRPLMRGGMSTGSYGIKYVWNTEDPITDQTVGVIKGQDLAAAKTLIGNQIAGAYMTSIRWDLCEDRDGEEPIEIGRFDMWDLLRDVSPDDVDRLVKAGKGPLLDRWDFDGMFLARECPRCHASITVNMLAYNIDSAKCNACGARPFLSGALASNLRRASIAVTGQGEHMVEPGKLLLSMVRWLGGVNAETRDLEISELAGGMTPQNVFEKLLDAAPALNMGSQTGGIQPLFDKLSKLPEDGPGMAAMALVAVNGLSSVVRRGGPFNDVHQKMAELLRTMMDKTG